MKNIYLITLKEHGYDEYDSWVVIAENQEEVIKLCKIVATKEEADDGWSRNQYKDNVESIKLIGTTEQEKSEVVLSSYNAG